ncbi:MAG: hypothetical protein M9921_12100 [Fimbriimonadaceae bacterium]|nr:hypothetical protein [Fimbriimonadaceae bacterium]
MAKTIDFKPEELFARSYVDRLILEKLTEMESALKLGELADKLKPHGINLTTVRSMLASNPGRFVYFERRWIPAARVEGAGRPFAAAVHLVVERFGGPMPLPLLIQEVALVRDVEPESIEAPLTRLVDVSPLFVATKTGDVALASWGFLASDETIERALALNDLSVEEFEEAKKLLKGIAWRKPGAAATALEKAAPMRAKAIGAVAWSEIDSQDPRTTLVFDARKFFAELLSVPGYIFAADGKIYPEAETKKWVSATVKLADKIAPTIEVEDAAPIEVKLTDVETMVKKIVASDATLTATSLLEEMYEITPGTKTFPDDMANVMAALQGEPEVWWVGADRFRKPNTAPDFIYSVPEPFQFVQTEFTDEEGERIDVELTDDGLSSSLRKLLSHPLATDVLDEEIQPAPKTMPEQLRLVLKSIHRELGTFPMCQIPTNWLDTEPTIQELILIDPEGRELQAWMNNEARLIYNLIDWWYEQPVESGAVFSLTKTAKPNVLEFAWLEQTDPVVYISSQRMEELREIQTRADGMSTLDVLVEVMGHWPKGADFLTILAEVNVVRRTSRRLVASLLSSYLCFYQRSGSPVWHYDAKKYDQGFDKTKRKFVVKK